MRVKGVGGVRVKGEEGRVRAKGWEEEGEGRGGKSEGEGGGRGEGERKVDVRSETSTRW